MEKKGKKKKEKKDKERRKDSDITNQEGQLNIHVNSIILRGNSVKKAMRRYLLSFQKAKTFFRINYLNSKNNGPVLLLKTIFRH